MSPWPIRKKIRYGPTRVFERSIEQVDLLCDSIEYYFGRHAVARVSGAGLGAAVATIARTGYVQAIRDVLTDKGFASIPPIIPATGASVLYAQ